MRPLLTRSSKNEADVTNWERCCCGKIGPSRQLLCCLLPREQAALLGTTLARFAVGRLVDATLADCMVDCIVCDVWGLAL